MWRGGSLLRLKRGCTVLNMHAEQADTVRVCAGNAHALVSACRWSSKGH